MWVENVVICWKNRLVPGIHAPDLLSMLMLAFFVRAHVFGRLSGLRRFLPILLPAFLGFGCMLPTQPPPEPGTVVRLVTIPGTHDCYFTSGTIHGTLQVDDGTNFIQKRFFQL
ncbi:MAG: hypothetical protein ABGY42_17105, partial [bacterium]